MGEAFVTPTPTNDHRDALCFLVMGPSLLQRLAVGGWQRLAAVGGWRLVVGGGWRLALSVDGWRMAVGGLWGRSLRAFLNKKIFRLLQDPPADKSNVHTQQQHIKELTWEDVYSVQCTVYSVQCTVYSVQCTVYRLQ